MDYKQFLSDTIPENAFWFSSGAVVRNIYELVKELKIIDENTFKYHSNPNRDDFAKWINDALGDDILSKMLKYVRNKKAYISIIERRIAFAERRNNAKGIRKIVYVNIIDRIKQNKSFILKMSAAVLIVMLLLLIFFSFSMQYKIRTLNEQLYILEEKNQVYNVYLAQQLLKIQQAVQPAENISLENYSFIIPPEKTVLAPSSHISKESVAVFDDKVILYVDEPSWATFANSSSMMPVLDNNAKSIEIKPKSIQDLHIGDIISYKLGSYLIIHRIIDIGYDEQGFYIIAKGDNNDVADPAKVRFEQVEGIVVALIY